MTEGVNKLLRYKDYLRSECSLTAFDFALIVASFVVVLEVRHKVSFKVVPSVIKIEVRNIHYFPPFGFYTLISLIFTH